jgi:PII-like signaling protein
MKLVRLYVLQNNRRWHEDITYGDHLERVAELEMDGAHVYHAKMLAPAAKARRSRSGARLKQRLM